MIGCDCPHEANEHGTAAEFGAAMCLAIDCGCQGIREQVVAMKADIAKHALPVGEQLVAAIWSVLSNPMPRTIEDQSRNIAAAVMANFRIETL